MRTVHSGQFYSFMVLLIILPLALFLSLSTTSYQDTKSDISEKIVSDQIHQVAKSIEDDFERGLRISVKRAFIAAADDVITNGSYYPFNVSNTNISYAQAAVGVLAYYGLLPRTPEKTAYVMINNTMLDWRAKILNVSTGFETTVDLPSAQVDYIDGLDIVATFKLNLLVRDALKIAKIEKVNDPHTIHLSAEGLEDPIFAMSTGTLVRRVYAKYPYPFYTRKILTGEAAAQKCQGDVTFNPKENNNSRILVTTNASQATGSFAGIVGETTDVPLVTCYLVKATNAIALINQTLVELNNEYRSIYLDNASRAAWSLPINRALEKGYYRPGYGPNPFRRLEGFLIPDLINETYRGLESFVNIPQLQQAGIPIKTDQTSMDYIYFSNYTLLGNKTRGLPDWFRIDDIFAPIYGLTELVEPRP